VRTTDDAVRARLTVQYGRFWLMAFDRGEPPVHWIVQVDPRGETSLRQVASTLALLG
jgi:hypothetical protein